MSCPADGLLLDGTDGAFRTKNANITKIKDQLRDQCYSNYTDLSLGGQEVPVATVSSFPSDCKEDSKSCAPDVIEYLSKNAGAKYGMKAGKKVAKKASTIMKNVVKNFKGIALKGALAFSFVGSFVSAFFPSAGSLPTNPCTFAGDENSGKCVWEQVRPFVEKFVDAKIDDLFQEVWQKNLEGYQTNLQDIRDRAYLDSEHFPNGTISNMPDETRKQMFDALNSLNGAMVRDSPTFASDHNVNTTASLYLSMFAGMHISVMSSVFGSWDLRTAGNRFVSQRHILCYAQIVVLRAIQARNARLEAVRVNIGRHYKNCYFWGHNFPCGGQQFDYKDTWQGVCDYQSRCDQEITCGAIPGPTSCGTGPSCDQSDEQHHFDCHSAYVEEQGDLMWQDWIAAVPDWIELVKDMQEADVKNDGLPGLGDKELTCPW